VVTLLQVFSDYINNAYRNIETVEKFEFAIVARSAEVEVAVARMDYLRTMLDLAGSRNDYVNLLSVPRANVKSNSVFGQDSGISPYTVNYNCAEIVDRIENASSLVPGIMGFDDGDVIFVNYDSIPGENEHEVAYYYDMETNCLIRDPSGKSQDPFTGSDNSSGRILSFRVSDVSSVSTRYGYTTDKGTQYREVFFTARIYDVKSEDSVKGITLPGGKEGIVDYYGAERTPAGKMRTVVRFDGENGWAWKNGFPTAIIYLSETSGANLVNAGGSGDNRLPMDLCTDPEYLDELNRYAVVDTPVIKDSVLTVKLGSCYPAYSNGTVYLAVKRSLQILGEFNVIKDDRESGSIDLRLSPVGRMPAISGVGELVLIDLPLFYGRGMLDYTQSSPIIRLVMDKDMVLDRKDEDGLNLVPDDRMQSYACTAKSNISIGELTIVRKDDPARTATDSYMDGGFTVVVPFGSDIAKNFNDGKYDLGDRIYIGGGHEYWSGTAIVKEFSPVEDGYAIKLEGIGAIRPSGETAQIIVAKAGYFNVLDNVVDGIFNASLLSEEGSPVVLVGNGGRLVARMYPDGRFDRQVPDGHYTMEVLEKTEDRARKLLQVDDSGDSIMTIWARSRGDLFTRPYMMLVDGVGNVQVGTVVFNEGEEVVELVPGEYRKGQYVYDRVSRKIYLCGEDCMVQDVNSVESSSVFSEDRIVHYSIPYSEKFNPFMPFYGQVAALEYGERIGYTDDPEVFSSPMYITKVEEKSLKYGWEHREFLNYGDSLSISGRPRNGMVELYSTERAGSTCYEGGGEVTVDSVMDIVNSDLFERCTWSYPHAVVTRGCSSTISVDIDDPVSLCAVRDSGSGKWNVTVHSAAHGLVDGALVTVSGISTGYVKGQPVDFNIFLAPVDVIDRDTFTYPITVSPGVQGDRCYADKADGTIVYMRDHHAGVASISLDGDGNLSVMFTDKVHGPAVGDSLYLEGCKVGETDFPVGPYVVVEVNDDFTGVTLAVPFDRSILPVPTEHAIVRKTIMEGDVVVITDSSDSPVDFYEVNAGIWTEVERDSLVTPLYLFAQNNLFDLSLTNPAYALGDGIRIREIIYNGNGSATVHLSSPIPHFNEENRGYIEGKTVVRIINVTPSDFNGLHVVTKVHSPSSFDIAMRLYNNYTNTGTPTGDLEMTLFECRWYRYTIDEIEWEKTSSQATFAGKNGTTLTGKDGDRVSLSCIYAHGLAVGDYAVLGTSFDSFDETTGLGGFAMGKVVEVGSTMSVTLRMVYGKYADGMSIARGVITVPGKDNLVRRNGEYALRLESIGNETYYFTDGDIVVAAGQTIPSERMAYLVRSNVGWSVLKRKRIMKIRKATVDEYQNSYYMDGTVEAGLDEYKYATYSDVDVAMMADRAYAVRMSMVRNPIFNRPAIESIDTTRNPNAEYSSGEDYANVAPRTDMKSSFHGVPDLKYPLIEKIERLAYLRDANVIDFDLIGYLARFMGYDITPMADDVQTSNLYRTVKQQEAAIREAVLNLPQYYALGGTDSGLKMLMGAFGVIGDVLTLYTNTMHPYEELLNEAEVEGRMGEDSTNGSIEGSWVSTPYIDIALTDDSRFPQFAIQTDDVRRIREQIRVWKPIQVVFRDVLLRYVGEIELNSWISGPMVGIGEFGAAIGAGETDAVAEPDYVDQELTSCDF
jgi:hypothetical protein